MKRTDELKDLRRKAPAALAKERAELAAALRDLSFRRGSGQMKDVREFREVRSRLARLNTIISQAAKA